MKRPLKTPITALFLAFILFQGCVNDDNGLPTFTDEEQQNYIDAFAERSGVVMTDSGLLYEEIEPGSGEQPGPDSIVSFSLLGMLIDGTIIANTGGVQQENRIGEFIDGLREGMQLMRPGARFMFVVPSDLAYPDPAELAGYVLVFEVVLHEVSDGGAPTD